VRVLRAQWPTGLPDDDLALTASRHWRLLQALHGLHTAEVGGSSPLAPTRSLAGSIVYLIRYT